MRRRFWPLVAFGASYAIASLGCTIEPFLAVVITSFRTGSSPAAGVALFLTYAAGMALVVGSVALAVAVADASLVRALRRAGPLINRLGGLLLVVAGLYVAWYGWYEIRIFANPDTTDPIIDGAADVQTALSQWLANLGTITVVVAFAVLLAAAITAIMIARRRKSGVRSAPPANPAHLAGLRHVKVPVTDLARSRSWYERVFGLRVTLEFADDDGVVRGVAGDLPGLGDTLVALRVYPEAARGCRNFDPFHFGLEGSADLEAWASYLDTVGVAHSPVIEATVGWLLVFNDPDGLEIHLYTWEAHGIDQSGRPGYGRAAADEP